MHRQKHEQRKQTNSDLAMFSSTARKFFTVLSQNTSFDK